MNQLKRVLKCFQYRQRTPEWDKIRGKLLTATDIASVLEYNEYQTKQEKFSQKINAFAFGRSKTNEAMEHGIKYEPIANSLTSVEYKTDIHDLGFKVHDSINFLGASPDGVMLLNNQVTLVEFKCPLYRKITQRVPFMYWVQMQIQMEVWDVNQCLYSEYQFAEYPNHEEYMKDNDHIKGIMNQNHLPTYWYVTNNWNQIINRDNQWFKNIYSYLVKFWQTVKTGILGHEESNKPYSIIDFREIDWSQYVNPYDITNYLLEDPILDWYVYRSKLYPDEYVKDKYPRFSFQKFIETKNHYFKQLVLDQLSKRESSFINIANDDKLPSTSLDYNIQFHYPLKSVDNLNRTLDEMHKGTVIIANALLYDPTKHIYGKADLLVRKDHLVKLFKKPLEGLQSWNPKTHPATTATLAPVEIIIHSLNDRSRLDPNAYTTVNNNNNKRKSTEAKNPSKRQKIDINDDNDNGNDNDDKSIKGSIEHEYVIIQIKYSTLNLMADGLHLLNNPKQKIYKGQSSILLQTLNYMQGKSGTKAYILGRKTKFTSKGCIYETDVIDYNVGIVDYGGKDAGYQELYLSAQEWLKTLGRHSLHPNPSLLNIYPNMKNDRDFPWHGEKKKLAHQTKDLSLVLGMGPEKCKRLRHLGVFSWDQLTLVDLYTVKVTNPDMVWEIIQANRKGVIRNVERLLTNNFITKPSDIEIYIDLETVSGLDDNMNSYPRAGGQALITMIGSYVKNNVTGEGYFINYLIERLDKGMEKDMMQAWLNEITEIVKDSEVKLIHWSNAEYIHIERVLNGSTFRIKKDLNLIDLYDIFKKNHIAIPNVFSYGLKDVARGLNSLGKIQTIWQDDIDGTQAMVAFWQANKLAKQRNCNIGEIDYIDDIIRYNYIDCKTLEEITTYLRREINSYVL